MNDYVCSRCGAKAFYDGRCGDGPVLMCGCDRKGSVYVQDGRGGYWTNPTQAQPVKEDDYSDGRDPDDYWKYR